MIRVENLLSEQHLLNRDVLFSYLYRRSTTYFHSTPTACLPCVDFERHLVSVGGGSGTCSDRCAYVIDLTRCWFIEYTFIRLIAVKSSEIMNSK